MFGQLIDFKDYALAGAAYFLEKFFGVWTMSSHLTPIDAITEVSPLVIRVLGQNPSSLTLQGTNTYIVGNGNNRILIDTGERNIHAYIDKLREALGKLKIAYIICTHWHDDHVGGIADIFREIIHDTVPVYKLKRSDAPEDESKYHYVDDGHIFKIDGASLRCIATPGHTTDHMSLFLEEENTLFSGDCVLGEGTCVFEDLYDYMGSLQKLLSLKPRRLYPGHGSIVENPAEKITEYINHRNQREKEIVEALNTLKSGSSMQITNIVYKNLQFALKLAAVNNVQLHLKKLVREGRIRATGADTYQIRN